MTNSILTVPTILESGAPPSQPHHILDPRNASQPTFFARVLRSAMAVTPVQKSASKNTSACCFEKLVAPFDLYVLQASGESYFYNGRELFTRYLNSIAMDPLSFKLFAPPTIWSPMLTKFSPGHGVRLLTADGDNNSTHIDISLKSSPDGLRWRC